MNQHTMMTLALTLGALGLAGCGGGAVGSEEDARLAYMGLDKSIDKAIQLGFDGFNTASSANISPQTAKGTLAGTMTINGQVDQGASSNKTMKLTEQLVMYSDVDKFTYDTGSALPVLDMKLSMIPTGTLDGTLVGTYNISGELKGVVNLNVSFHSDLQAGMAPVMVERKPMTTHITGTANSDYGIYNIDLTR